MRRKTIPQVEDGELIIQNKSRDTLDWLSTHTSTQASARNKFGRGNSFGEGIIYGPWPSVETDEKSR